MATPAPSRVPSDMHTVTPHLICADASGALDFYRRAFGAREHSRLPGADGRLMHAAMQIGDSMVMLVDEMPEWGALGPKSRQGTSVTLHLSVEDADATIAQAVDAGATVVMPAEDAFWGDRYGIVEDPYGHRWSIAHRQWIKTPEEIAKDFEAVAGTGGCAER